MDIVGVCGGIGLELFDEEIIEIFRWLMATTESQFCSAHLWVQTNMPSDGMLRQAQFAPPLSCLLIDIFPVEMRLWSHLSQNNLPFQYRRPKIDRVPRVIKPVFASSCCSETEISLFGNFVG